MLRGCFPTVLKATRNLNIIRLMVSLVPLRFNLRDSAHVCSAQFCHLNHFCHSSPLLSTFVNTEVYSFVNNINHLCRYRRGHYFSQPRPTTFVNRNCIAYLRVLCSVTLRSNQLVFCNLLIRFYSQQKELNG